MLCISRFLSLSFFIFTLQIVLLPQVSADIEKGKEIYVAQCLSCHGSSGEGQAEPLAPRLKSQHNWYIVTQMENYRTGVRKTNVMVHKSLSANQSQWVAEYLASLK